MEQEEIKRQVDCNYETIRRAQSDIEHLRWLCKHPNTFEGNYSWRVGSISPATICSDCGQIVKYSEVYGKPFEIPSNLTK